MGNHLPTPRHASHRKQASVSVNDVAKLERASSANKINQGLANKTRSAGVRLRNAVNSRLSGRASRRQIVSCPDLDTGSVPCIAGIDDAGVLPATTSTTSVVTRRPPSSSQAPVDVTVYRSYNGSGPRQDDTRDAGLADTVTAVPDIKIYRRSAVLYDDDEDYDDELCADAARPDAARPKVPPPQNRHPDDVDSNDVTRVRPNRVAGRATQAVEKEVARTRKTTKKITSCTAESSSGYRVTLGDFPDVSVIDRRLRRFEEQFGDSLLLRYRSMQSIADRLSVLSVAVHLQSRPRRTVSLLQYLCGDVITQPGDASMPSVPVELIDQNGDNNGEFIVTIPDGLFHVVRLARLQRVARKSSGNDDVGDEMSVDEMQVWSVLGEEIVRCVSFEAGRELSRMFEYQIGLLAEDTAIGMLAQHAVECAVAYIERQSPVTSSDQRPTVSTRSHRRKQAVTSGCRRGGLWERNSIVRGAVFGAVFGHTETTTTCSLADGGQGHASIADGETGSSIRRRVATVGRQVSVVIGQRELKWDIGDILKRPGLRRDRLLYAADLSVSDDVPPTPPPPFSGPNPRRQLHSSTSGIDTVSSAVDRCRRSAVQSSGGSLGLLPSLNKPSTTAGPSGLRRTDSEPRSSSKCSAPWTFHVSAACDARLYGYRGSLLDWDYFTQVYTEVIDDEGWFDQVITDDNDDFHRIYQPRRCLIGTALMQAYCCNSGSTGTHHQRPSSARPVSASEKSISLADLLSSRIREFTGGSSLSVVPVYRPLKALALGSSSRLRHADFTSADLTRVRLVEGDLRHTLLRASSLSFSRLAGVKLGSASGSTTVGCDLSYAVLHDVELPVELRLVGEDRKLFQTADRTLNAVFAVVETSVCVNTSLDVTSDDIDLHSGSKVIAVCSPNESLMSVEELLLRLRRRAGETGRHSSLLGKGSTGPAELPSSGLRISNRPQSFACALVDFKPEVVPKTDELLKTKSKKKRKKRRFVFSRNILEDRSNDADSIDKVGAGACSRTANKAVCSSSSDDIGKKEKSKTKKKKRTRKKCTKDEVLNKTQETSFARNEEAFPVADNNNQTGSNYVTSTAVSKGNATKVTESPKNDTKPEVDKQVSLSANDVTSVDSCLSESSQPELIYRQVDCVIATVSDDDNDYEYKRNNGTDEFFFLIDDDSMLTSHPALQLHCSVEKGPELLRRPEAPDKQQVDNEQPLKPTSLVNNSNLPPKQPRSGREQHHSPTLPPRTYSKNTDAGFLADVHGSLPVLTVDNRKNSSARSQGADRGVEGAVSGDVVLSKSACSLQARHRVAIGESLVATKQSPSRTGRRTFSQLDIENINRSQIIKMISDLTVKPIQSVLPTVDPLVVGRRREIDDVVELMDTSGRVVTITGGHGSGKSTLALCVAHALCGRPSMTSPVAVHVDLAGCRTVESVFRRTVRVFGVHFRFDERRFLYNWINARDQKLLVIYDNLDDLLTHANHRETHRLSDLIDELLTRVRNVRLMCTGGRKQFYHGVGAESEVYRIGDIRASDACEVLGRMLPDMPCDRVDQVTALCGHVSTSLKVVATALSLTANAFFDTGNLLESLTSCKHSSNARLVEWVERMADGDEYQQRRLFPVVECLSKVICALGETPGKLLRAVASFTSGFDWRSVAALVPDCADRDVIESSLNFMADIGLVLPVRRETADVDNLEIDRCRRYRLPALVRSVAMAMSSAQDVGQWSALYRREVLGRLSTAAERYHEGAAGYSTAQRIIDDDLDNMVDVLWMTVEREDAFAELSYLTSTESSAFLGEFLPDELYTAVYEAIEREAASALSTDDVAMAVDRKLTRSHALACLSYRHSLNGRVADAILCAERAIDLARFPTSSSGDSLTSGGEEIGDTSRQVHTSTLAMCLCSLSRALWVAGERRKSLANAKQAFDAWKSDRSVTSQAATATEVLPSLTSVSAVYASDWYAWMLVQSENFQAARHCYNVSDALVRDRLSGHPMTIDGFDSRRAVWDRLSLFERASGAARTAAETARLRLGEHPRTAVLLARLGDSIVKRGSLTDAISAVVDALQMRLSVLGPRHRDTVASYRTLANLMLRTGQYDQAERFARTAIEAATAIWARRRTPSDQEDDDGDDGYEDGGSSSVRGGLATDDDGVPLEKIVAEAKNIVGQAQYRSECRSMVFVQLETRSELPDEISTHRPRRKL